MASHPPPPPERLFAHTRESLPIGSNEELVVHRWEGQLELSGCCVLTFHGYGSHACYPTIRFASELLALEGHTVYGLDFKGHGESFGTRGLIRSSRELIDTGVLMVKWVSKREPKKPLVLLGVSMGGAVALHVSLKVPELVRSVVLVAPMLGIAETSLPPLWQQTLLRGIACVAPAAALLGGSAASDPAQQYKDESRRAECVSDEKQYHGAMRLATAAACLETALELASSFDEISTPFLCLAAGKDTVVDVAGPPKLMEQSSTPSEQKKLVVFPEALHGLLCEPLPVRAQVEKEIVQWVGQWSPTPQLPLPGK